MPFGLESFVPLLLDAPASAVAGETIHMHLALWHGLTPVFLTSLAAITAGLVLFLARDGVRATIQAIPWPNGQTLFKKRVIGGLYATAQRVTQLVQGRTLAGHASFILLAAVGMVVYALTWATDLTQIIPFGNDWEAWVAALPHVQEITLFGVAVAAAILTLVTHPRLEAIISLGVVGISVTLAFVFFGAPDLALTQLLIEVLTVVLLVLVFYRIPWQNRPPLEGRVLFRNMFVAIAMGILGFIVVMITAQPALFPTISNFFMLNSVSEAHGGNVVNVILVDFRGYDTMGEITVLAIAALGGFALLRSTLRRRTDRSSPDLAGTIGEDGGTKRYHG
jgi:multicomponent Na+:H+ antiporter subunit A